MLAGLRAGLPRVKCWTLAEHTEQVSPYARQHLLARAQWDHDAVRDDLRGYVVDRLGDQNAVLVVDLCRHRDHAEERDRCAWA